MIITGTITKATHASTFIAVAGLSRDFRAIGKVVDLKNGQLELGDIDAANLRAEGGALEALIEMHREGGVYANAARHTEAAAALPAFRAALGLEEIAIAGDMLVASVPAGGDLDAEVARVSAECGFDETSPYTAHRVYWARGFDLDGNARDNWVWTDDVHHERCAFEARG